MAQVSLAWSLTRVTAPILGSTSIKNLEELISACNYFMLENDADRLVCRWYRDHVDARRDSVFGGAIQGTFCDGTYVMNCLKGSDCEKEKGSFTCYSKVESDNN